MIDYKNGLLSAQIVELEEKLKALELAMKGHPETAPLPIAAPRPVVNVLPAAPPEVIPKASEFPWLLAAAIVALLVTLAGAVLFVLVRRKSRQATTVPTAPSSWYARIAARLRRKAKGQAVAEAEPSKEA